MSTLLASQPNLQPKASTSSPPLGNPNTNQGTNKQKIQLPQVIVMAADAHYASSAMTKYFLHPPWHPMYLLAQDAVEQVRKLCAANVYAKNEGVGSTLKSRRAQREWCFAIPHLLAHQH